MPPPQGWEPAIASGDQVRFDAFAQIKGITGESTDLAHSGWVEVLAFQWGVRQPSGTGGGSATMERADFDDFTIFKVNDKASPLLYSYCARGSEIPEVRIEFVESTKDRHNFATFILKKAIISRVRVLSAVTAVTAGRPVEEVGFRYAQIEWQYTPVDHTGKPGGKIMASWDLEANIP